MSRRFRAPAGGLAAVLALLLLAVGPAVAQQSPGEGLQLDGSGSYLLLGGEVFELPENGFGYGGAARWKWPTGLTVGAGGRVGFPDVEVPEDGTLQDFTVAQGFAEATYSLLASGVARPFVGVRLGFIDITRDVTLPPDAPVFGDRPPWMATGQEGSGFTYGAVVGSEFWFSDDVALRVAGTGSRFSLSGFEALVEDAGRDPGSGVLGVELGISVFLGESADSDRDGVRDGLDECPGTPPSVVVVDTSGCPIDSDDDGVADYRDGCPGTPGGVEVDGRGCAEDTDDDGVLDDRDECEETPRGAFVDEAGCAVDSDADGVPDGVDQCSGTPEGAPVDAEGCVPDDDGDGVPDPDDACPGSLEEAEVNADGCTGAQQGLRDGRLVLHDVTFREGTAQLTADGIDALSRVGNAVASLSGLEVEIGAHTADAGAAARALSERRAEAVQRYLTDLYPEIDADRLTPRGYGGSDPLAGGETREQNERIELVVTGETGGDSGGGDGTNGGSRDGGNREDVATR